MDKLKVSVVEEDYTQGLGCHFTIYVGKVPVRVGDNVGLQAREVAVLVHTGLSLLKLKMEEEGGEGRG